MDWMDHPVVIDAAAAAVIAAGMRAVARADGDVHQRELELIESFEAQLPAEGRADAALDAAPDVRDAYLRSLIMVALADGRISDAEKQVILNLAGDQGFAAEQVEAEIVEVKRRFLGVFAGVSVFREAVVGVAEQLGLSADEVEALRTDA